MGLWKKLKEIWKGLDYVPDCPACKGTGESTVQGWAEWVWWKGQVVPVCHQCKGTGKV